MSDFAALAATVLIVCSLMLFALALVVKTWQDGSLKADLKFASRATRIYIAHAKNRFTN